jgi:hypothetical protein
MSVSKPPTLPVDLDPALWTRLVQSASEEEFCRAWLALQAHWIDGVSAGMVALLRPGETRPASVAQWPDSSADAASLDAVIERALHERKGVPLRVDGDGEAHVQLAYPIVVGDDLRGAAALRIAPRPPLALQSAMRQLQWGAVWLQNWGLRASPPAAESGRVADAMDIVALVLQEERFLASATALVTELATRFRCDRVTIGFLEGRHVKIRALSHSAQFGKIMNLLRAISGAMGESLDQEDILLYPEPAGAGGSRLLHAHEQLARGHGDRAICTIPFLRPDGRAFGAVTLERSAVEPFDPQTVQLGDSVAALAAPILDEKRRNDRFLDLKAWDTLCLPRPPSATACGAAGRRAARFLEIGWDAKDRTGRRAQHFLRGAPEQRPLQIRRAARRAQDDQAHGALRRMLENLLKRPSPSDEKLAGNVAAPLSGLRHDLFETPAAPLLQPFPQLLLRNLGQAGDLRQPLPVDDVENVKARVSIATHGQSLLERPPARFREIQPDENRLALPLVPFFPASMVAHDSHAPLLHRAPGTLAGSLRWTECSKRNAIPASGGGN